MWHVEDQSIDTLWLRPVSVASPYGCICSQLLDPEDEGVIVLRKVWNSDLEDMTWDPRSTESFIYARVNNFKYFMIFFHLLHPVDKSSKSCSIQSEDIEASANSINSTYITLKNLVCFKWEIVLCEILWNIHSLIVLRWSLRIPDQFAGDLWIHFCDGYIEVEFFFNGRNKIPLKFIVEYLLLVMCLFHKIIRMSWLGTTLYPRSEC